MQAVTNSELNASITKLIKAIGLLSYKIITVLTTIDKTALCSIVRDVTQPL